MNGKHGGHERGPPERSGQLPQNEEQENGRRGVKQDVGQVMSARVGSINLPVQLVGNVRHRKPSVDIGVGEQPSHPRPA